MDEVRVMVDDQPPFREAAAAVVDSMDGFTVVATARRVRARWPWPGPLAWTWC